MERIQDADAGQIEAEAGGDAESGGADAMIHRTGRVRATVSRVCIGLG